MSVSAQSKSLSVFALIMINVIVVDNLRSLTVGAEFGFTLVFFYLLAALLFFIPTILVTAELATGWPTTGGVYIWVREAFGLRLGFLSIWLQWIYNVVWYPTIFIFIAGIFAYLINPALVENKIFMLSIILTSFWGVTLLNCLGLKGSSFLSIVGAIIGNIFPMLLIACLGLVWIYKGLPSQIHFTLKDFLPNMTHLQNLAFLTNVLFGLMGMEMSAVHAGDVKNPKKDYPRALFISAVIILSTMIFSCLAIAVVVAKDKLSLVSGLMDAFAIFFHAYHLEWFLPIIAIFNIVGSLGGASTWLLGSARGMLIAGRDAQFPAFFTYHNKKNMPVGILCLQGLIVTLLCLVFFIMPSINSSYWLLSNLTAQLALIFYIFMFAAAIRLRYKYPQVVRAYRIPGGRWGLWIVCGTGILTCAATIVLGFIPPVQIALGNVFQYQLMLLAGMFICCGLPLFFYKKFH